MAFYDSYIVHDQQTYTNYIFLEFHLKKNFHQVYFAVTNAHRDLKRFAIDFL